MKTTARRGREEIGRNGSEMRHVLPIIRRKLSRARLKSLDGAKTQLRTQLAAGLAANTLATSRNAAWFSGLAMNPAS